MESIPDRLRSPRVLVLRRDNIGDLVCTTPLIDALRSTLPGAWIAALVNSYNAEVLEGNRALDAIYVYEKLKHRRGSLLGNLLGRVRLMSDLRKSAFDYVLVPAASGRGMSLAASLKAKKVIAAKPFADDPRHEVLRCFSLGGALGATGRPGPMRVFPDHSIVERLAVEIGRGFIAVHISARQEIRRWPHYVELIRELQKQAAVRLLWAPGRRDDPRHPGDDELAKSIVQASGAVPLPTPDLKTLTAAISLADRVVCPDGGAMHIAAALGKPIVALWADSPVERWRPWGVAHRVVRPDSLKLADLPLAAVLDAYHDLSEEARAGN